MLKATYEKRDDIPEALREFYTERDGKWELQVEGVKTQGDLDRVQRALENEKSEHAKTKSKLETLKVFDGMDHDEIQEKLDKLEAIEAKGGDKDGDDIESRVSKIVETREARIKRPLEREISDLKAKLDEATGKVTDLTTKEHRRTIRDKAWNALKKMGVDEHARADAELAAVTMLTIEESTGEVITAEGGQFQPNLGLETWAQEILQARPLWNGASQGGGAGGTRPGNRVAAKDNPYTPEGWNVTKQGQLMRDNPEQAKRMADAAGVDVHATRPKEAAK